MRMRMRMRMRIFPSPIFVLVLVLVLYYLSLYCHISQERYHCHVYLQHYIHLPLHVDHRFRGLGLWSLESCWARGLCVVYYILWRWGTQVYEVMWWGTVWDVMVCCDQTGIDFRSVDRAEPEMRLIYPRSITPAARRTLGSSITV